MNAVASLATGLKRDMTFAAAASIPDAHSKKARPSTRYAGEAQSTLNNHLVNSQNNLGGNKYVIPEAKWDLKAKVEGLEGTVGALREALEARIATCTNLEIKLSKISSEMSEIIKEKSTLEAQLQVTQQEAIAGAGIKEERAKRTQAEATISRLHEDLLALQSQLALAQEQHCKFLNEADVLNRTILEWQERYNKVAGGAQDLAANLETSEKRAEQLQKALDETNVKLECLQESFEEIDVRLTGVIGQNAALKDALTLSEQISTQRLQELTDCNALVAELKVQLQQHELLRRKLHNSVQELRGNIRVYCRIRPLLPNERNTGGTSVLEVNQEEDGPTQSLTLRQAVDGVMGNKESRQTPFTFDRVFGPEATQATVFDDLSQLVQSALDGYRVCIFAYGQTGSGKTHTMEGSSREDPGMIPRSVELLFQQASELERLKGWSYSFSCSFMEIYNENIRDLLSTNSTALSSCSFCFCRLDRRRFGREAVA